LSTTNSVAAAGPFTVAIGWAALLPVPSVNTWVQWRLDWAATPGSHTVRVRATDGTGAVQPEARVTPFPDGATGWHTVTLNVA